MDRNEHIKRRVLEYLEQHEPLPGIEEEKLAYDYLDQGHVDSIGIVTMVGELEKDFSVRLEPAHMQSEEFRTVGGLIRIFQRLAA